jgi:hypothetical protein
MGKRKDRTVVDEKGSSDLKDAISRDPKQSKKDSIPLGIVHVPMSSDDDEAEDISHVKKGRGDKEGRKRSKCKDNTTNDAPGASEANLWFRRCSRILKACADEGHAKMIASTLATWSLKVGSVRTQCSGQVR